MAHLIDKDTLVAEIDRRVSDLYPKNGQGMVVTKILKDHYKDLKDFINTLEVKEVDLEKEIQDHIKECLDVKFPTTDIEIIKKDVTYTARKFFELGLKAKQTSEDIKK